jgi:hypothetical protein
LFGGTGLGAAAARRLGVDVTSTVAVVAAVAAVVAVGASTAPAGARADASRRLAATTFAARAVAGADTFVAAPPFGRAASHHSCTDRSLIPNFAAAAAVP